MASLLLAARNLAADGTRLGLTVAATGLSVALILLLLCDTAREKGKSVVVVSHDQRLRELADRVLWLEDGRSEQLSAMVVDPCAGWRSRRTGPSANHWVELALVTPVMLYSGWPIHRTGWLSLAHRSAEMNSLIAIGTSAAFGYSLFVTVAPALLPSGLRDVYFEAVGVIITLIPLGRLFEARAKAGTGEAIRKLADGHGIWMTPPQPELWLYRPNAGLQLMHRFEDGITRTISGSCT
jgi:energy-coupling factor transporter ATP-binding protein EcfA2